MFYEMMATRIFHKSIVSMFLNVLAKAFGLGISIILARQLGPAGYGVYALAYSLVILAAVPAQLGLPTIVVRETVRAFATSDWGKLKGLWKWSNLIVLGMSSVIAIIFIFITLIMQERIEKDLFLTCVFGVILIPLLSLGNLRGAALRGLGWIVMGQLPETLFRSGIFFLFLFIAINFFDQRPLTSSDTMALHVVAAAAAFVVGALVLWYARPYPTDDRSRSIYETRKWMSSALALSIVSGMMLINQNTDILMLGMLREPREVGIYKVVLSLATLVAFGLVSITMVVSPKFAQLHIEQNKEGLRQLAQQSARLILLVALPCTLCFIFFGQIFLTVAFGEEYQDGHLPLKILALGQMINAGFGSVGALLNMSGNERSTALGVTLAAIINIVLNAILIPPFGMLGAAIATTVSMALWNFFLWRAVLKHLGISSLAFGKGDIG